MKMCGIHLIVRVVGTQRSVPKLEKAVSSAERW